MNPSRHKEPASVPPEWQSVEMRRQRALAATRRRYAEDELQAAVARGAAQYVILGAGLDTFAYSNPNPHVRVFEVDRPETQAWKRAQMDAAGIAIPPSLALVPADFDHRSLAAALQDAGFQGRAISFFSWLSVALYPNAQATLATLGFIGSLPAGSGVVFDYPARGSSLDLAKDAAHGPQQETAMDALASRFAAGGGAVQHFVDSRALDRLLRSVGFQEVEDLAPAEMDRRYRSDRADGLRVSPGLAHFVSARV